MLQFPVLVLKTYPGGFGEPVVFVRFGVFADACVQMGGTTVTKHNWAVGFPRGLLGYVLQ